MNYNNTTGQATVVKENLEKKVLADNFNKVNFIYFIGLNQDMDLYAMDNIVRFLKQYENKIKLQFIFQDEQSKKSFEIAHKHNPEFSILNNYKMTVLPNEFKDFNIYTTPSLVAINKEAKTGQTIITGRVSENQANKMIVMYLRSQGIIQDVELNPNNAWKDESDFGEQYIKEYLGEDYIKEIKNAASDARNPPGAGKQYLLHRPQLCRPYCRIEKRNAHRASGVYEAEQQHSASGCGH